MYIYCKRITILVELWSLSQGKEGNTVSIKTFINLCVMHCTSVFSCCSSLLIVCIKSIMKLSLQVSFLLIHNVLELITKESKKLTTQGKIIF